jgi:hypothetical protein
MYLDAFDAMIHDVVIIFIFLLIILIFIILLLILLFSFQTIPSVKFAVETT